LVGFNYAGELRVGANTVTLDSGGVVSLGNLTTLGENASPGVLNALNGFVLDFGEAITGYGAVNASSSLDKHSVINGSLLGQPITLTGWFKGVGTLDHINFGIDGHFDPGFSPTLASVGSVGWLARSTLNIELGGTMRGSQYDAVVASGHLALGGTLTISLINNYLPAVGATFDILDWASLSGKFASIQLPSLGNGLTWDTSQLYVNGSLVVTGLPGDYSNDGKVDAADYVIWRKGLGTTYTQNDYNVLRTHFGQTTGGGSGNKQGIVLLASAHSM
jgi:hypothetical protein